MGSNRVIFFIFNSVHLLDLAGAVTVFYESGCCGEPYEIHYVSTSPNPETSSGLGFTNVKLLDSVTVCATDVVIVAGMEIAKWNRADDALWIPWLQAAAATGATVCSVCTAAFALAVAGLLDHRDCTTHWGYTAALQKHFPRLNVVENKLFVQSGRIFTSAGIATGIDLALYLLEERHGVAFACQVAKDMVVYIRRDGKESQNSIYLQNRQHINYQVHQVQDYITGHLDHKLNIEELAALACVSPRNLTRIFKSATGITIGQYIQTLRQEKARHLLKSGYKLDWIAKTCGYQSATQLRRAVKKLPA